MNLSDLSTRKKLTLAAAIAVAFVLFGSIGAAIFVTAKDLYWHAKQDHRAVHALAEVEMRRMRAAAPK